MNACYDLQDFQIIVEMETDYKKLCKLIAPLLKNWKYKDKYGDSFFKVGWKFSEILDSLFSKYFNNNIQVKVFSIEDKEMLLHIFKFLQRAYFFSKADSIQIFNVYKTLIFALSFDTEVSIQAFKVISLSYHSENFFYKMDDSLKRHFIKLIDTNRIIIENYSNDENNDFETSDGENKRQKLQQEEEIFYTIKKVYALLLFKYSIKNNSINKKNLKEFCEEILKKLKAFLNKNSEEKDEIQFCIDRLILFLFYQKVERVEILNYLEVETEMDYRKKVLSYNENSKFEEILSFSILEKLYDIKDKINYKLIINKGNPDFDYAYLRVVYDYVKFDEECIENDRVDFEEYRKILENLKDFVNGEDLNVLRLIFKILNKIYIEQEFLLEDFSSGIYLKNMGDLLDVNRPNLLECIIKTCCFFMERNIPKVEKIISHSKIHKILNYDWVNFKSFEPICKLMRFSRKEPVLLGKIGTENIMGSLFDYLFKSKLEHTKLLNKESLQPFILWAVEDEHAQSIALLGMLNYIFTYLRGRNNNLSECDIINDINFFRLFMIKNPKTDDFNRFLKNHFEIILITFDELIRKNIPDCLLWQAEFFTMFKKHDSNIFPATEIPIYYILQRVVNLLPEINKFISGYDTENLVILERYLYAICNIVTEIDEFGYDDEFLRFYNIILNIAMNLIPSLFRLRSEFSVEFSTIDDLKKIIKDHFNMEYTLSGILSTIWNELLYLVNVSLVWDDICGGELTTVFLDHTHPGFKDRIYYDLKYLKTTLIPENSSNYFITYLMDWNPEIKIINLADDEDIEYKKFIVNFTAKCLVLKERNSIKCFYRWIGINGIFRENLTPWPLEKVFDTLDQIKIDEDDYDLLIGEENIMQNLIFVDLEIEKRVLKYINKICNGYEEYSEFVHDRLVELYCKHFDFKEIVMYKAFSDNKFINKILEEKSFINLIENNLLDISLDYVNNQFIDSSDFVKLYIFVLTSVTFSEINTGKLKSTIKIDLKLISKYLKMILKSTEIEVEIKISCCIAILRYLSGSLIIMKMSFYEKILNFAIRSINLNSESLSIKILMVHLLESPYDVMTKMNLFDNHLRTFRDFADFYQKLAFTNINGFRAKLERKINNKEGDSITDYKYVLDTIHKELFRKLLKFAVRNVNALNLVTEILFNNPRYSKYITKKFILKVIRNHILKFENFLDFEVAIKFIGICLKSDDKMLQNYATRILKKAIRTVENQKLINLVIVLFRSLDFIDFINHKEENYVISNKFNEISEIFITKGIINLLIDRVSGCSKEDLNQNFQFRSIDNDILDFKSTSSYKSMISYIYTFISSVYKGYFKDAYSYEYDSRSEILRNDDIFIKKENVVNIKINFDISDEVDCFKSTQNLDSKDFLHKKITKKIDNPFRRIYTSYYLYDLDFKNDFNFVNKIVKIFKEQDNLRKLKISNWESQKFINLTDNIKYVKPDIEIKQMTDIQLKNFIKEWNKSRSDLKEYISIDFKFLKELNIKKRNIFLKEEKILKSKFNRIPTYKNEFSEIDIPDLLRPDLWNYLPDYETHLALKDRLDKLTSTKIEKHISEDFLDGLTTSKKLLFVKYEDLIAKTHASLLFRKHKKRDFTMKKGIKQKTIFKFLKKISKEDEFFLPEISNFLNTICSSLYIEDFVFRIIKKKLFNICKLEINFEKLLIPLEIFNALKDDLEDQFNRKSDLIILIYALSRFPELSFYTLNILNYASVFFRDFSINEIQKYSTDLNPDLLIPKFHSLENIISDKKVISNDKEVISNDKEVIIDNNKLDNIIDNNMLDNKLDNYDNDKEVISNDNNELDNINELDNNDNKLDNINKLDDIEMLLWNIKELLKRNCSLESKKEIIFLGEFKLKSYMEELLEMILKDHNLTLKEIKFISELVEVHKYNDEKFMRNEVEEIREKYEKFPSGLFLKMDFHFLLSLGIYENEDCNSYNSTLIEIMHNIIENVKFNKKDFLICLGIYENYIKKLAISRVKNKKFLIERYFSVRSKFEIRAIEDKDFYNEIFPDFSDILVRFSFISFNNKIKHLRRKINEEISFFRGDCIELCISRDNILDDSFDQIMTLEVNTFKNSQLEIIFEDEDGIDEGGLTKEWLDSLAKEITNQDYKFNSLNIETTRFIGRIMGKAIIDNYNFPINLDKTVYKFLLNKKCDLEDLKEVDIQFYKSLIWMRENSIKDILNLTFTYENDLLTEDLKLDGKDIEVTDNNKNEYIDLIIQRKFINDKLIALKMGLFDMVDEQLINILNEKELELLICGLFEININDWKLNTYYINYTINSRTIIWFWEVVEELNNEDRGKLLHFCTGSSRMTYSDSYKFKICRTLRIGLPTAHTCFNQLDLPEYQTYDELKKNILYAINECHGVYGLA